MAKPIEFRPLAENPRDEIQRRLAEASIEHSEALLACYKLIQEAQNSGIIDILRGLLGAHDAVLTQLSTVLAAPEAIGALRNGLGLMKLLGSIDADKLNAVVNSLTGAVSQVSTDSTPSILSLLSRATSQDSRRALQVALAALEATGKALRT